MKDKLVVERLKHYENLLRERGIDPNQVTTSPGAERQHQNARAEVHETVRQVLTPASTINDPQAITHKPKLLQGQQGTKLVDK